MKRLLAFLALAAVLAVAACQPVATPAAGDSGSQLVVLFGDSLTVMSGPETEALFADDTAEQVSFNAYSGTELDTTIWLETYPAVPPGATVLLFLGTNDISVNTLTQIKAQYRWAIATVTNAGAARVVTNTINETSADTFGGQARLDKTRAVNDWLRQADASTHPDYRALSLADWAAVSAGQTGWIGPDGIHHTLAGQTAYAEFTWEAAQ